MIILQLQLNEYNQKKECEDLSESDKELLNKNINELEIQRDIYKEQIKIYDKEISSLSAEKLEIQNYAVAQSDGIITNIYISAGICKPGIAYEIKNCKGYIITSKIEQKYYENINIDDLVSFKPSFSNTDKEFSGNVEKKDCVISKDENGDCYFNIKINFDDKTTEGYSLAIGMQLECSIQIKSQNKLPICSYSSILKDADNTNYIYIYNDKNRKIKKVNIKLGDANNSYVQIISGIENGDFIVVNPKDNYYNNETVASAKVGE